MRREEEGAEQEHQEREQKERVDLTGQRRAEENSIKHGLREEVCVCVGGG